MEQTTGRPAGEDAGRADAGRVPGPVVDEDGARGRAETLPSQAARVRTPPEGTPTRPRGTSSDGASHEVPPGAAGEPQAPARAWSAGSAVVLAATGVVLLAAVMWHLAMLFLTIAPPNRLSVAYRRQIDAYVYPEFGQYWQLFAPNPLQRDNVVEARVRTVGRVGPWVNLSAQDDAAIRHNPIPSHTEQNMLRRAWDSYMQSHDLRSGKPLGLRGRATAEYLERLGLQRLGAAGRADRPDGIQFRITAFPVPVPVTVPGGGSGSRPGRAATVVLPWWPVDDADYRGL